MDEGWNTLASPGVNCPSITGADHGEPMVTGTDHEDHAAGVPVVTFAGSAAPVRDSSADSASETRTSVGEIVSGGTTRGEQCQYDAANALATGCSSFLQETAT